MNSLDVLTNFTAKMRTRWSRLNTIHSASAQHLHPWRGVYRREHRCSNECVLDRANSESHTEEGKLPRNQKDDGEDWSKLRETWRSSGTCFGATRVHLVPELGVFWPAGALLSFLPSSEPLHLQHLNMSFAGAHQFVASNNTFNEAKTMSGMIILRPHHFHHKALTQYWYFPH